MADFEPISGGGDFEPVGAPTAQADFEATSAPPSDFEPADQTNWYQPSRLLPMATRVGGALVSPVGGVPGATAAAAGETAAQIEERLFGTRSELNLPQIGMQAAIGAVPFGKAAEALGVTSRAGRALTGALEGGAVGAGATAGQDYLVEGKTPTLERTAEGGIFGAGLGGLGGSLSPEAARMAPGAEEGALKPRSWLQRAKAGVFTSATPEGKAAQMDLSTSESAASLQRLQAKQALTEEYAKYQNVDPAYLRDFNDRIFASQREVKPAPRKSREPVATDPNAPAGWGSVGTDWHQGPEFTRSLLGKFTPGPAGLEAGIKVAPPEGAPWMDQEGIVYRGSDGTPVAGATLVRDPQTGELRVKDMAVDKSRGLLGPRAVKSILEEMNKRGVRGGATVMSTDATRMIEGINRRQARIQFTSEEQKTLDAINSVLKPARQQLIENGVDVGNIETNYLPLLSKNPEALKQYLAAEGGGTGLATGRLMERRATLQDVRQYGGGLVSENPVELGLNAAYQEARLGVAASSLRKGQESGMLRPSADALPGWQQIDPQITDALRFPRLSGPADYVSSVNDHLNLNSGVGQTAQQALNAVAALRQFQVAASAYHYSFESLAGMAESLGRGVGEITSGQIGRGLKSLALPLDVFDSVRLGRETINAAKGADLVAGNLPANVEKAITGGFNFDNTQRLGASISELVQEEGHAALSFLGKAGTIVSNAVEKISAPLMQKYVPYLKLGMALKRTESEAARLGRPLNDQEIFDVFRHTDAAFGQMAAVNSPFRKTARQVLSAVIQFPGWNVGSGQLIKGALKTPLTIARGVAPKLLGEASVRDKAASEFALGVAITTALAGTMVQYAMTGELPQTLTDAFYPKTGKKRPDGSDERLQLPTYVRDAVSIGHGVPRKVAAGRGADAISQLAQNIEQTLYAKSGLAVRVPSEISRNQDFYGRQIFDPNASVGKNVEYGGEYALEQVTPFSMRQFTQPTGEGPPAIGSSLIGEKAASTLGGVMGLSRPPAFVGRSSAEQDMADITSRELSAKPGISRADFEKRQQKKLIREKVRAGAPDAAQVLTQGLRAGTVTPKDVRAFVKQSGETVIQTKFRGLKVADALRAYQDATNDERIQLAPILAKKIRAAQKAGNVGELQGLTDSTGGF